MSQHPAIVSALVTAQTQSTDIIGALHRVYYDWNQHLPGTRLRLLTEARQSAERLLNDIRIAETAAVALNAAAEAA